MHSTALLPVDASLFISYGDVRISPENLRDLTLYGTKSAGVVAGERMMRDRVSRKDRQRAS